MREKKKNRIEILGIAMLVLLISGVCMIPCFKTGLPYGDDQQVHMLRVESILKALKSGQGYPVYIYQTMLEGYGYGMGIFYPDLFLLPAVLFRLLGASPEIAMKIYIYVLMICTGLTAYYTGRSIGRSRCAGVVTMVLYTMGHYHLEDVYTRFALGEIAAMVFIPLAFLALYDLTEMGHSRKGLLCVSYSCLMLSHTISFVLCVVMGIIWVCARWKRIAACRRLIGAVCMEALACAVLTCYYWLPVLEQFADGRFYVSNEPAFYTHEETQTLLAIVSGKYSVAFIEIGILALMVFVSIYKKVFDVPCDSGGASCMRDKDFSMETYRQNSICQYTVSVETEYVHRILCGTWSCTSVSGYNKAVAIIQKKCVFMCGWKHTYRYF